MSKQPGAGPGAGPIEAPGTPVGEASQRKSGNTEKTATVKFRFFQKPTYNNYLLLGNLPLFEKQSNKAKTETKTEMINTRQIVSRFQEPGILSESHT